MFLTFTVTATSTAVSLKATANLKHLGFPLSRFLSSCVPNIREFAISSGLRALTHSVFQQSHTRQIYRGLKSVQHSESHSYEIWKAG